MDSNAKFDKDFDFDIKHDLNLRFDGDMSAQSQVAEKTHKSENVHSLITATCEKIQSTVRIFLVHGVKMQLVLDLINTKQT